jgi:hypothetical protein
MISSGHTKLTTDSGFRCSKTEMPRFLPSEARFLGFFGVGHSHDGRKKAYFQSRNLIRWLRLGTLLVVMLKAHS